MSNIEEIRKREQELLEMNAQMDKQNDQMKSEINSITFIIP